MFRPSFVDRRGVRHFAAAYGRKVFVFCAACKHSPFGK